MDRGAQMYMDSLAASSMSGGHREAPSFEGMTMDEVMRYVDTAPARTRGSRTDYRGHRERTHREGRHQRDGARHMAGREAAAARRRGRVLPLCGKRIVNVAHAGKLEMGDDGSGDFMGTLPMNMHLRCIDGLEVVDLLVRYRKALAAALRGTKEDA